MLQINTDFLLGNNKNQTKNYEKETSITNYGLGGKGTIRIDFGHPAACKLRITGLVGKAIIRIDFGRLAAGKLRITISG